MVSGMSTSSAPGDARRDAAAGVWERSRTMPQRGRSTREDRRKLEPLPNSWRDPRPGSGVGHWLIGVVHALEPKKAVRRIVAYDRGPVVVDAEKIDRRANRPQISIGRRWKMRRDLLEHVGRVAATEDRVKEPAIEIGIGTL